MKGSNAYKIDFDDSEVKSTQNCKILCKPFLKWVGGKGQLLSELKKRIPENVARYYEPFIGGGALYFNYQPRHAYISDLNSELIDAYTVIRDDVDSLIKCLKKHHYNEEYFYSVRNVDRNSAFKKWSAAKRAARLIFLNKTCFNGLYRVNSKGYFNTPFGQYTNPKILDIENLNACSKVLQNTTIKLASFESIESRIHPDDFVYFDPPYVPLSDTAYFTSYSSAGFDINMQKKLFELCCRLHKKGIRFMLSNSSSPFILDLYKKFKIDLVEASRAVNSNAAKRGKIHEVIVTNY